MDDLLDLSWSDQPKPSTASSQASSRRATPGPSFDFLSKPQSTGNTPHYYTTTPPVRSQTPKTAPLPSQPRLPTPNLDKRANTPQPAPPSSSSDAFSSLLSLGTTQSASVKALSLQERQQKIAEEQRKKEQHEREQFSAHGSFWDNLGSSSQSATIAPTPVLAAPSSKPSSFTNGFDDLLSPQPVKTHRAAESNVAPSPPPPGNNKGEWDDDDTFLAGPSISKPQPASQMANDPFDFDSFEATVKTISSSSKDNPASGMRTPVSNFDFGDGKRDRIDDDNDLLGDLSRHKTSPRPKAPSESNAGRPGKKRSSSPPPQTVNAVMNVGFSEEEARWALAQTSNGLDADAAANLLLERASELRSPEVDRNRSNRREEEGEKISAAERQRRRRAGPSRASVLPRSREELRQEEESRGEYGEQADKILAQASEMGQSFLKNATSFWNSGKEKALKMYEEQKRGVDANRRRDMTDGRPRWMIDAEEMEAKENTDRRNAFRDAEHETGPFKPSNRSNGSARQEAPPAQTKRPEMNLLGQADEPRSYQPSSRHRIPNRSAAPSPRPPRPVTPPPLQKRSLVNATPSQMSSSSAQKARGNDHFKLGRFAEAESAYTAAIAALPEGHLFLVPIYNNRAATRIKLGESSAAVEDCTTVITLIGPTYHPSKEAPLPSDHAEIKLGDALVKAMTKRAQAWEMGEKWSKALEDWERVLGFDPALMGSAVSSTRTLASDGINRARKMLEPPKPKPAFRPGSSRAKPVKPADSMIPSKGVEDLRKAEQAAEAEDAQRIAVKDSVDAKVVAWKAGKETNLRALIASLDIVLWDEILKGGLKVGMHELITEKQVKIKYMKVIARLHPDKLDTKKTTVEQRMLANSAFSALNEAWQAFSST